MNFHVITIFPKLFDSYLSDSIMKRAIDTGIVNISFYNPRDFTENKHKNVDDIPYGGGPGMVMTVQPIIDTWSHIIENIDKGFFSIIKQKIISKMNLPRKKTRVKTIVLSPGGKKFNTMYARNVVEEYKDIIFICGRYEGIDNRVAEITGAELVSIGDYVLTGGELAAMVMIDSISRQIKGVLGNIKSLEEDRVSSHEMYTRPSVFKYNKKDYSVPEVLMRGNHKDINEWRKKH